MWRGLVVVGLIMAAGSLYVLDASLPGGFLDGGGDLRYAQTRVFTTLMLFQMFNVLNARSDERSAFVRPFTNVWLWGAIGVSVRAVEGRLYRARAALRAALGDAMGDFS